MAKRFCYLTTSLLLLRDFSFARFSTMNDALFLKHLWSEFNGSFVLQLEKAHGNRMSSMFQMKEDVENEFSERMEQLRDMYKTEIEDLMFKLETERSTAKELEVGTFQNQI